MAIRGGGGFITGEQRIFACALPAGWLECNGAAVLRAAYPGLFLAIGETYGPGDGATTFNLPDKRGRGSISEGAGSGLTARTKGQKIGAEAVAITVNEMPSHGHNLNVLVTGVGGGSGFFANNSINPLAGAVVNNGGGEAHSNMPPVEVDLWGIKF